MSDNKIVYLFASSHRQVYKQDNINALCYPSGFIMHFRYDVKWVDKEIYNKSPKEIEGKEAIIVTVDEGINEEHFPRLYPIRKAKIKKFEIDGSVAHFYFELISEWVDYRENDNQEFIDLLEKKPIKGKEGLRGIFASLDKSQKCIKLSPEVKAWESVIQKLGNLDSYNETLFYRFNGIYETSTNKRLDLTEFDIFRCGYKLNSGTKYILELSFSYGKEPPDAAIKNKLMIEVDTNNNFYVPIPKEISLGFRVDKQNVFLSTRELFSDEQTYLAISFKEDTIEAPNVLIPIKIKKTNKTYFYVLLTLIGLIFVTGTISENIQIMSPYKNILQLLGTILATTGTWFLSK